MSRRHDNPESGISFKIILFSISRAGELLDFSVLIISFNSGRLILKSKYDGYLPLMHSSKRGAMSGPIRGQSGYVSMISCLLEKNLCIRVYKDM